MVSVMSAAPLADQARVVVTPVVLVDGVAVKEAIDGPGFAEAIVAELCTGTWRSLTTSTFTIAGVVLTVKVMERVFRPAVIVPLVNDQSGRQCRTDSPQSHCAMGQRR